MASLSCTQLGDIEGLGKIHLEQRAFAESHRKHIESSVRIRCASKLMVSSQCALHGLIVTIFESGSLHIFWNIVTVNRGKALLNLGATAMTMHVTEAADVHENVKAEPLAAMEGA